MKRDCLVALLLVCMVVASAPGARGVGLGDGQDSSAGKPMPDVKSRSGPGKVGSPTVKTGQSKTTAKSDKRPEEIKWKVRSLGIASRVTVKLNNGNERYGSIERIDEDSFQLAEVDIKQVFTVSYSDVRKIREGYGNPNQFTGKRWNPIWAKIAVTAVIVMFAIVIPLSIRRT